MDLSVLFDNIRDVYAKVSYNNKLGKAIMPLRYFLELTYLCNLNCPFCYVGNERIKKELNTKEWFNVIEQIPHYSLISLVGGEVLIRPDFIDIFKKASKQTFNKVNVVSNGILLNKEIIDSFIKYKLLLLSVSLDGFEKNHDKNRGKDGIFDLIINNLEEFNKKRTKNRPMLDIKTIVLENNLDDIVKLYKLSAKLNADFFSISFKRINNLKQNSQLRETFGEEFYVQEYPIEQYFDMPHFKEVYRELEALSKRIKTKIRLAPKFNPVGDLEKIEKFFLQQNTEIQKIYKPCMYPFSNIHINPEGDVYPCLSYKMGNVKTDKIKEILNTTKFRCFRKNLKASELFTSCQMCCELTPKIQ